MTEIHQPKSIVHQMIHLERKGSKLVTGFFRRCKIKSIKSSDRSVFTSSTAKTGKSHTRRSSEQLFELEEFLETTLEELVGVDDEQDVNNMSFCRDASDFHQAELDAPKCALVLTPEYPSRKQLRAGDEPERLSTEASACRTVSQDEFLRECIMPDGCPAGTVSIVHIFHNDFSDCPIVDSQLEAIIPSLPPYCRAIRLCAIDAPFVTVRLKVFRFPTVLVIRDGQILAKHTSQFGDDITNFSLRKWLRAHIP